jgi:hypothetical protein
VSSEGDPLAVETDIRSTRRALRAESVQAQTVSRQSRKNEDTHQKVSKVSKRYQRQKVSKVSKRYQS